MWYILVAGNRILRYNLGPAAEAVMPGALDGPHLSVLAVAGLPCRRRPNGGPLFPRMVWEVGQRDVEEMRARIDS